MIFTELRYQDLSTQTYLGSPSLVRLDNGELLATHDYFGPGCPRNHEHEEHLTSLYRSRDNGRSWASVNHIAGAYWSTLFTHRSAVYILGVTQGYGSIVIRRSRDGGNTWTLPKDESTGLLFRGGPFREPPSYHGAPVPICIHEGRLYRAFEDNATDRWPAGFRSCIISAPVDADLLDTANWTMSNKLAFDPAWLPKEWGALETAGWLEGNVIADPQWQLWNVLRFSARPAVWDSACLVRIEEEGRLLSFDPQSGFIHLPGGHTKFTIRRDPASGLYFTLSNGSLDPAEPAHRTVLALYASPNLREWRRLTVLLQDDSSLPYAERVQRIGFQYPDWQFDGEDIIALVRTAYGGAHNYHDANRITFHRIRRFRALID
jgi:hypothetical protein